MKKQINAIMSILFLFSINFSHCQNVKEIEQKIKKINEVQYYGQNGPFENFKNFELLKKKTKTDYLLKLTDSQNPVLATYASFGLIDKKYKNIFSIYQKFIGNDRPVVTLSGCIGDQSTSSTEFYFYYKSSLEKSKIATNKNLIKMDSIILTNKNTHKDIIGIVLKNRKYEEKYMPQIEYFAFEKEYLSAINYIISLNNPKYENQIKNVMLNIVMKADLSSIDLNDYKFFVDKLLTYNDNEINFKIISMIKSNDFNPSVKPDFVELLKKHNLKAE